MYFLPSYPFWAGGLKGIVASKIRRRGLESFLILPKNEVGFLQRRLSLCGALVLDEFVFLVVHIDAVSLVADFNQFDIGFVRSRYGSAHWDKEDSRTIINLTERK